MKIEQMTSASSMREVANQFIIYAKEGRYFQSYKSIIAFISNEGHITLDNHYWDYSTTTGRYRNQFLHEGIEETRKKIKSGSYTLANLNEGE